MAKIPEASKNAWTEPESDFAPKYPYNNVFQSESGHFQEFDDTPGAERIRTQHRTGSFTEIQADGSEVTTIIGDKYTIVHKNNNVLIKGTCNITIEGDSIVDIIGDKIERITGNYYQQISGNFEQVVEKEIKQTSGGDVALNVGGVLGTYTIRAGGHVDLHSDLDVDGGISGSSVNSTGSVSADKGMYAGASGIATIGGISAGFPSASGPGVITATASVSAPLISGIITKDIRGTMEAIRLGFDIHTHGVIAHSYTTPPIPLM